MSFSAVADCPKCGSLDIHWLSEPKLRPQPSDPFMEYLQTVVIGIPYDPPGTEVARVCKKCEHRWPMS